MGFAYFRPVRNGNAFEETVERLLQAIKLGIVTHGDRLPPERELAERLNVSRATLREAIRELTRAKFVESRRGRFGGGTFVIYQPGDHPVPIPDLLQPLPHLGDSLLFRRVIEAGAAEAAGSRDLSDAERDYLQGRLDEAGHVGDVPHFRQMDSRFHLAIAELSRSPTLAAAVADCRIAVNKFLDAIPVLEKNVRHAKAQHRRVAQAILAGDPQGARAAMEEHLAATEALLRGFLT